MDMQGLRPNRFRFVFRPMVAFVLSGILFLMAGCNTAMAVRGTSTAVVSSGTSGSSTGIFRLISPQEAKQMLADRPEVVLLDVRTAEEYDAGHIAGSKLLPYDEILARVSDLPADKMTPIIVYCRSGRRSAIAAETLAGLGFMEIYDLGGIQLWPYETVMG